MTGLVTFVTLVTVDNEVWRCADVRGHQRNDTPRIKCAPDFDGPPRGPEYVTPSSWGITNRLYHASWYK